MPGTDGKGRRVYRLGRAGGRWPMAGLGWKGRGNVGDGEEHAESTARCPDGGTSAGDGRANRRWLSGRHQARHQPATTVSFARPSDPSAYPTTDGSALLVLGNVTY